MRINEITTTTITAGAVLTPLLTYPLPGGVGGLLHCRVTAKNTATGRCANTIVDFGAQNLAGVAAILGTPAIGLSIANGSDAAMALVLVTVSVSGGNVVINGTGLAATNIQWTCSLGPAVHA